ncbi:PIR Superfamily Protein [Plasmodium ovale curtisi]|uniref:PIR Superfamily Protein n=1 Tax=Plasmodium ovale curtisi TaxID=864141 RepID=A0A1A8WMV9_PLAOA|nr:PIR Superfamily Protein [Plasmodium ovale curtisi]
MGIILQKEDLDKLWSNVYYGRLNNAINVYCYSSNSWDDIETHLNGYPGVEHISSNITKAICYVFNLPEGMSFYKESCKYLYYWIGDKLLHNLKDPSQFSNAIDTLYDKLNDRTENNKCNYHFTHTGKDAFTKRKVVYDYSQNYETMKRDLGVLETSCNNEYLKELNNYVNKYKSVFDDCLNNQDLYCSEFKNIFSNYDYSDLSNLKCKLKEDTTIHSPHPQSERNPQQEDSPVSSSEQAQDMDHLISGPELSPPDDTSPIRNSKIFMYSTFPFVAISLICYMLYRFTPLWSIIRSHMIKKQISEHMLDENDTNDIQENTYEIGQTNSDEKRIFVSYLPSKYLCS